MQHPIKSCEKLSTVSDVFKSERKLAVPGHALLVICTPTLRKVCGNLQTLHGDDDIASEVNKYVVGSSVIKLLLLLLLLSSLLLLLLLFSKM